MKANDGFRHFNYRSTEKVLKEFMLYAFGKNIDKYHKFKAKKNRKFHGKNRTVCLEIKMLPS